MRTLNGIVFRVAQLPLVDYYKQLAWEVDHGFITEDDKKLEAVP